MKTTRRGFLVSLLSAGAAVTGSLLVGGVFPQNATAAETGGKKALIIFYSWSGNTRGIATEIQKKVGGDLIELELVKPYSTNYNTCLDEAQRDQRAEARPELKTRIANLEQCDVIYLGYPNWWATIPMPIATLLESYDFSGKTIAPFCSHGGGRLGQSVTDIAKLAPKTKITEGLSVHYSGGSSLSRDIDNWLQKNGLGA
ncbi:hypothetical protein LJC47_03260 [Desulfosarcina sp. OttesenSCG-928-B08]|nr:hypothetical protein [Desulfosarcina sp. OttesenSCG-928-B08]